MIFIYKLNLISFFSVGFHPQCISSVYLLSQVGTTQNAGNKESIKKYDFIINEMRGQSKSSNELNSVKSSDTTDNKKSIEAIKSIKENINLGKNDLWSLCPILLYQLVAPTELERSGCITTTSLLPAGLHHKHDHDHDHTGETDRKMGKHIFLK